MEKKITPVLKKTRTHVEEYEVCPHCNQEIGEKSSYIDPDNFVYHRPCMDKGPIEKIIPRMPAGWGDGENFLNAFKAVAAQVEPPKKETPVLEFHGGKIRVVSIGGEGYVENLPTLRLIKLRDLFTVEQLDDLNNRGLIEFVSRKPKKASITRDQWVEAGIKAGWIKQASQPPTEE